MAKKKNNTLRSRWIILLGIAVVVFAVFGLLKNNTPQSQPSPTRYQTYQDPKLGFSIEYPEAWEVKQDTQVFENGDAIAFRKTGPSQKEQTELTDGAQLAVSKPFSINTDLALWTKEYFGSQAKFSKFPIKDRVFEQVYTCSNLGCMTYFYTLIDDQVYGIAVFAEGPDKDKMVYENTTLYMLKSLKFENLKTGTISKAEAILKVKELPEVIDYLKRVPNGLVAVNGEEINVYMVQVYEFKDGHTATFNWYKVDKATGSVEKEF